MKVSGSGPASAASAPRAGARSAAADFAAAAPDESAAAAPAARAGALGAVSSLDALLALQETPGPLERRRRATARANGMLDALDALKLAMLEDDGDGAAATALTRLQTVARETADRTDDAGLAAVLDQIELRAAVEVAKRNKAATGPDASPSAVG